MSEASCILRQQGRPYPRTCAVCGLGPCGHAKPLRAATAGWQPVKGMPENEFVFLGVWIGERFHRKIGYRNDYGSFPGWEAIVLPEVWHPLPENPPKRTEPTP